MIETGGAETAVLTVDLGAIAANYARLAAMAAPAACGVSVKADAYGLGLERVARTLFAAGCRTFFVALPEEGLALRAILPGAEIYAFNGVWPGVEREMLEHGLKPVLNHPDQIALWAAQSKHRNSPPPGAALHVDTGMSRLGLEPAQVRALGNNEALLEKLNIGLVMSHLACADEPENPMNRRQLDSFNDLRRHLPPWPASLANSSGVFLNRDFHLDMVRPGIAVYGALRAASAENPMDRVVTLSARILQVRDVDSPMTVGYGATHAVQGPRRIATVSIGYADGCMRSAGAGCTARIAGVEVPVVGLVSMDLITLDVTDAPNGAAYPGAWAELIGDGLPLDVVAAREGVIPYKILTGFGPRIQRDYLDPNG